MVRFQLCLKDRLLCTDPFAITPFSPIEVLVVTYLTGFLLVIALITALSIVFFQWKTGVPPMPSKAIERQQALALVSKAQLGEGKLFDLGSGWGDLVLNLAQAFPERDIIGIEYSFLPYWVSLWRTRHLERVKIIRGNFFNQSLEDAAAIFCYLMIGPMPKVAKWLDQQLTRQTPVITLAFWFHERKPDIKSLANGPGVALYYWNKAQ